MDWGLISIIAAVTFLVAHVMIDGYRMFRNVRRLRHVNAESLDWQRCPRCLAIKEGLAGMRHEGILVATATVILAVHIVSDFVA